MTTSVISPGVPLFAMTPGDEIERQVDTKENAPWVPNNPMLSADIRNAVAFEIGYAVQEVQAVFAYLKQENSVLQVWTVVPDRDQDVYRRIYAVEKQLIAEFQHMGFEFNVVSSSGRDPKTLINDPGVELAFLR
jgi:hypothetical protein